jgi:dihydroorotate dehydrogenase (NAD+) catalytic subunit
LLAFLALLALLVVEWMNMSNLNTKIGPLKLKNPVLVASGTFGYGEEMAEFYDLSKLGAVVTKGISLKPRKGNPMPRTCEAPMGMINAIGLENVGLEAFLEEKLPFLIEKKATVIVNVFGESIEEYVNVARRLDTTKGVAAIELNISCPNVKAGGIQFGTNADTAAELTEAVRRKCNLPLIVKLSPLVADIANIAKMVEEAGADVLSVINTVPAMAIDVRTRKPKLANVVGGLSGPAIKPIALRLVWQTYNAVKIPIIGMGGIMTTQDALEFMIAGASAVQIGTGTFVQPNAAIEIIDGLTEYSKQHKLEDVIGSLSV